ncbi:tigger transposable element-derived protein 4-like [Octopus sinensis]|uniref:Tigger transposable element-derived protein 4-like n=1 Tax=Octopus sinensis TaxID=2607531 RepID=A0A6P7TTZ1_9MOLL|nr:tigger transposable element-derived protein 4-like [Octopus sinensis]XP_029655774.1 tigger transposable element-derived protein 4-like [Octopus sinensis]
MGRNVKLYFIPPNTSACIQPCDMGIIKSLKHNYRLAFLQRVIAVIDSDDACLKSVVNSITLLDALHMLKMVWREVKIATIYNCFRKAGFHEEVGENMFSDIECNEITMDVANEDEECIGIMYDEEICLMSRDISCEDDEDDEDPIPVKTTSSEAMGACRLIRQFLTNSDLTSEMDMENFYELEKKLYPNRLLITFSDLRKFLNLTR